jgi:succinyl-CoA synthetase beta subunit
MTNCAQVLIKERGKGSGIKKNSAAITKFFDDLAKIGEYCSRPACQTAIHTDTTSLINEL